MTAGFTGHPLIDAGLAAMTVLAGRSSLDELGLDDYQRVADWLFEELYTSYDAETGWYAQGPFKSYLVWLFPNSVWTTPSVPKEPEKATAALRDYAQETLYAFAQPADPQAGVCSFCGSPSVDRALRTKVPLLTGNFPNFSPMGTAGVPICGRCLLAVHALPLGGIVTKGRRLMIAHSNDAGLLMRFARRAVDHNLKAMQQARLAGWPQMPYPRTRLVELLREIERAAPGTLRGTVALYQLTNDNRGADLAIYRLLSPVIAFLREVEHPYERERHEAWLSVIQRAWVAEKGSDTLDESISRNRLYEDLYLLPDRAGEFLKRYILPARSWSLAACFIRKVMGMEEEQLALLYELGSRFANYAREKRAFYYDFVRLNSYSAWRRRLLSAADTWSRQGRVLISAEEFVQAFVAPRHAEFFDWRMARDIVALRMMEELARAGLITPEDEELIPDTLEDTQEANEN